MDKHNVPPELLALAKSLTEDIGKDMVIAADLANACSAFLMDRASMIDANPFLCWVLMVEIAKVNLEHQRETLVDPEKLRLLSRLLRKPTGDCKPILEEMIDTVIEEVRTSGKFRKEAIQK